MKKLNKIGRIFEKHGTDKANINYHIPYQKHLPKKAGNFLEIGTWLGGGIRAFREWYNNEGDFYTLNYRFGDGEIPTIKSLINEGFICFEGEQEDTGFLNTIKDVFDVIIDDGSHHSDSQIITFKHFFKNNLRNGGLYIIEDLHCCMNSYWWREIKSVEDTFLGVMREIRKGGTWESQLFTKEESKYFIKEVDKIVVAGDRNESIAFLWKK